MCIVHWLWLYFRASMRLKIVFYGYIYHITRVHCYLITLSNSEATNSRSSAQVKHVVEIAILLFCIPRFHLFIAIRIVLYPITIYY